MPSAPALDHPFLQWFGIDEAIIHRVIAEAMSRGPLFNAAVEQSA